MSVMEHQHAPVGLTAMTPNDLQVEPWPGDLLLNIAPQLSAGTFLRGVQVDLRVPVGREHHPAPQNEPYRL
ncbi:hypothetical protein D3C85_1859940 [compost metagenome]